MKKNTVKKFNNCLLTTSILAAVLFSQAQAARLPDGTLLSIEHGVGSATLVPCVSGSCYGYELSPGFVIWTDFGPGTDGGIVIGKNQVSGGQELAPSYYITTPGEITNAFMFPYNEYGTFYSPTGAIDNYFADTSCAGAACISVTQLGSWNHAWNGNSIPFGSANGCLSINCSPDQLAGIFITDYSIGLGHDARYSMSYSSVAPYGNSSGFGNVKYHLKLAGQVNVPPYPVAGFIVSNPIVEMPVQFTDASIMVGEGSSIAVWQWNFGDGNTSTEQNPIHTYNNGGDYTVTLTVKDAEGDASVTSSQTIRVEPVSIDLLSLDGSNGFRLNGEATSDLSGTSVSAAGDINGDGLDDLIIGAPGANVNSNYSDTSYVVFGNTQGFAAQFELSSLNGVNGFKLNGERQDDNSGRSVSAAGDINGDGLGDLIIGAPSADPNGAGSGASYVVFGSSQGFAAQLELSSLNGANGFKLNGEEFDNSAGTSVAAAGDINGDGLDDLIIGAYRADSNIIGLNGASYVVFGSTQGFAAQLELSSLDGANGFRLTGEASTDFSGISVSAAGDINGDGLDDLIIGAPGADLNGNNSGASYVVFGNTQGFAALLELSSLNGLNGFKLNGEIGGAESGHSVAAAGDVNGDGLDDLIIGAPKFSPGASYVVFGSTQGFVAQMELAALNGSNGFKINGEVAAARSGWSVSAAGDINGDGLDDIVIGTPPYRSHVVFGSRQAFAATVELSNLNGVNGFSLKGAGTSVSAAGDINGDGLDDLIIGDPGADSNGFSSGASYVVFGETAPCTEQPVANITTLPMGAAELGESITLLGGASYDPCGGPITYDWDLDNDGLFNDAFGLTVSTSWGGLPDIHTVNLSVMNAMGVSGTTSKDIKVGPPHLDAIWPSNPSSGDIIFMFGRNFKTQSGGLRSICYGELISINDTCTIWFQALSDDLVLSLVPPITQVDSVEVVTDIGTDRFLIGSSTNIAIWPKVINTADSLADIVFVFGSGFEPGMVVTLNGITVYMAQVLDNSLMIFIVPPNATSGPTCVTWPDASSQCSPIDLTVLP